MKITEIIDAKIIILMPEMQWICKVYNLIVIIIIY